MASRESLLSGLSLCVLCLCFYILHTYCDAERKRLTTATEAVQSIRALYPPVVWGHLAHLFTVERRKYEGKRSSSRRLPLTILSLSLSLYADFSVPFCKSSSIDFSLSH